MSIRDEAIEKAAGVFCRVLYKTDLRKYAKTQFWRVEFAALFDFGLLATPAMVEAAKACEAHNEQYPNSLTPPGHAYHRACDACTLAGRALVAERKLEPRYYCESGAGSTKVIDRKLPMPNYVAEFCGRGNIQHAIDHCDRLNAAEAR